MDIPHAGIASVAVADGPHGIRSTEPSTMFPSGISMGASWDPHLIERVGQALAEETAARGYDILLGPCVNIVRHPLAGRNFETLSEDPYLSAQIGTAYVKGVQSRGVGTSLKHFACNNQEHERGRGSSELSQRALREIYLPAFETIVKHASPWTVMCAYNRINGTFASENRDLLTRILREEWGYDGVVVSDWGATHSTHAVEAGLDLEMPGPAKHFGDFLADAIYHWQVSEQAAHHAARRMIHLAFRSQDHAPVRKKAASINTRAHTTLARELAESAITLLKNQNDTLPLHHAAITSLAIVGPNADQAVQGGGSSHVVSPYRTSPLEALRKALPKKTTITHVAGCTNRTSLSPIPLDYLTPSSGKGQGITVEFFDNHDFSGSPNVSRVDSNVNFGSWWFLQPVEEVKAGRYAIRWRGFIKVPESGTREMELSAIGHARMYLDNACILECTGNAPAYRNTVRTQVELKKNKRYAFRVEYLSTPAQGPIGLQAHIGTPESAYREEEIARAVETARGADAAVVFVGSSENFETEGHDRPDMELVGAQNRLVREIAAVNPRTIVVLSTGAPVALPWIDSVPAVLQSWFPGMEGGAAIANILLGKVCPCGKLPVSFPRRLQDTPAFPNYPGGRKVVYGEELLVGYRHYDTRDIAPLFAFGHGLSYTTFTYSGLKAPRTFTGSSPVTIEITVKNAGSVTGSEVVQLYVSDLESSLSRPAKELKAFQKLRLQPGSTKKVQFILDTRAFSFWDPAKNTWVAEPGTFKILIGRSSRDIRAEKTITMK